MPLLGITSNDLMNSGYNSLITSTTLLTCMGTAWVVNEMGHRAFAIKGYRFSTPSLMMKGFSFAVGAAVTFPLVSRMPSLAPFAGKQTLHFSWLVLLDLGGVIPGYFGQRSLYVVGFSGAFFGAFNSNLRRLSEYP